LKTQHARAGDVIFKVSPPPPPPPPPLLLLLLLPLCPHAVCSI
jgi:hypothetical protein